MIYSPRASTENCSGSLFSLSSSHSANAASVRSRGISVIVPFLRSTTVTGCMTLWLTHPRATRRGASFLCAGWAIDLHGLRRWGL